jgi:hypothetical protein
MNQIAYSVLLIRKDVDIVVANKNKNDCARIKGLHMLLLRQAAVRLYQFFKDPEVHFLSLESSPVKLER